MIFALCLLTLAVCLPIETVTELVPSVPTVDTGVVSGDCFQGEGVEVYDFEGDGWFEGDVDGYGFEEDGWFENDFEDEEGVPFDFDVSFAEADEGVVLDDEVVGGDSHAEADAEKPVENNESQFIGAGHDQDRSPAIIK